MFSLARLPPRKERLSVDEAETVAPRIARVERALAPRTFDDLAGALAMDLFLRERAQLPGACMKRFELVDGEVEVLRKRSRRLLGGEQRQDHVTAVEVDAATADFSSFLAEHPRRERVSAFGVCDLQECP